MSGIMTEFMVACCVLECPLRGMTQDRENAVQSAAGHGKVW